jgi:hypothetical protein
VALLPCFDDWGLATPKRHVFSTLFVSMLILWHVDIRGSGKRGHRHIPLSIDGGQIILGDLGSTDKNSTSRDCLGIGIIADLPEYQTGFVRKTYPAAREYTASA